jgi:hypothetical protein
MISPAGVRAVELGFLTSANYNTYFVKINTLCPLTC